MPKNHDIAIDPAGFRYIDDTVTRLPANIALVTAATRTEALTQMFNLMAADPSKNFIVWNPPEPFVPDHYTTITRQVHKKAGFDISTDYIDYSNPGKVSALIAKTLKIHGDREFVRDIKDTRVLTSTIKGRAISLFNTAANAPFNFKDVLYQVCARSSDLGVVNRNTVINPDSFSFAFHIDKTDWKNLRILTTARGIGTYVADSKDIEYFIQPDLRLDFMEELLLINAQFKNPNPVIWVLKEHSIAMMRSGGTPNDKNWFPAFHSQPFASPLAPEGQKRIFERSILRLA